MNLPSFSSVTDYVAFHADASSDVNAISSENVRLSYSEVADEVGRYARALQAAGVGPGTFVGVLGPCRPECFIAFLACCRIGATYAGLNPRHTVGELSVVVTDCQPTVILCLEGESSDGLTEKVLALRPALNAEAVLVSRTHRTEGGLVSLNDFLDEGRHVELTSTSPDSPAAIVYTSGSTGTPKGALLSQRSLVRSAHLSWEYWYDAPVRPKAVTHHPINHVGWLVVKSLATFIAGGSLNMRERFDPREHLRLVEQEKVTLWNLHPAELAMTMETDVFSTCDLSSVEHVAFGTSPSLELVNRLQERTDAVISVSYGLTEASGGAVIATNPSTDPKSVTTSIGRVLPGVEIRIVTIDGADAETGTPGELLIRDESVFSGYLNRPEEARSAIDRDGWLHTGDVVTQASDGSLSLTGRLTEMFKSGGYNIYPTEIEQVLASHPAVRAVAVLAAPDPRWTQVGVAFVVTKTGDDVGEDDLNEYCRKHLANYKVPKRFEFVPSLPQLRNGKIDRLTLRSEAERLVTEASADREAAPRRA